MKENSDIQDWKIPLYKVYTDDEDLQLITKIVKRGTNWAIGPEIKEFEESLKNYVGTEYCLTLNSGTSALHASLLANNLNENHEIIIPSFSFIATANSVLFVGSKPKFSDIEEKTWGLDPNEIRKNITKKTGAIMPMDYGGMSCDIFEIKKIAEENNLHLIEDAAESLGSKINGEKVGTVSDCAIFSFCGNKVLTTGEGGALVTNSKEIYEKILSIRSHGRVEQENYFNSVGKSNYLGLGYNWRMSSITAALGITQLQKLDKIIKRRQENANYISSRISKFKQIKVPIAPTNIEHIYQMYTIMLDNENTRNKLQEFLTNKRIITKIYFNPIHLTKYYKENFNIDRKQLTKTESISKKILTLPIYPNMDLEEKKYLVESIAEFFELKIN